MTAVAVTPSASARARTAAHTSSGMRTVRAGVLGWLGIRLLPDERVNSAVVDDLAVSEEQGFIDRLEVLDGLVRLCDGGEGCAVGAVLASDCVGVAVDDVGVGAGLVGACVCVHGFTLRGVIHLVKSRKETP